MLLGVLLVAQGVRLGSCVSSPACSFSTGRYRTPTVADGLAAEAALGTSVSNECNVFIPMIVIMSYRRFLARKIDFLYYF